MRIKIWLMRLLIILLMGATTFANAQRAPQFYGYYFCGDCHIQSLPVTLPNVVLFTGTNSIAPQGWWPGDIFFLCDGNSCALIKWAGTTWVYQAPMISDQPNHNYKNEKGATIGGALYLAQLGAGRILQHQTMPAGH